MLTGRVLRRSQPAEIEMNTKVISTNNPLKCLLTLRHKVQTALNSQKDQYHWINCICIEMLIWTNLKT